MKAGRAMVGWAAAGCLAFGGVLAAPYCFSQGESHWAARPGAADAPVMALLPDADPAAGARLFRRCAACHTIGDGTPDLSGPNLYGVLGAPVGGNRRRYAYTRALRAAGGRWDFKRMDAWLKNPQHFAPGTSMAFPGLPASTDRADVIAYLNSQGSNLPLPVPPEQSAAR